MRVILIGGGGFLGSNLALQLINSGQKVIVYDQREIDTRYDGIDYYCGKFEETDKLEKLIQKEDCVVHLICTSVPINSDKDIYADAYKNILSSIRLFEVCASKSVKKIIFSSSGGSVYGIPDYLPIDELHRTNPISAYGINKLAIEKYLYLIAKRNQIQALSLRISNPYGPGQKPFIGQGVIATFIASALLNRPLDIWGDGTATRDYIFIDDVVTAFVKAIQYDGKTDIFNIGSGKGSHIDDIVRIIEGKIGRNIVKNYYGESEVEVKDNILNCNRARQNMGWEAKISIETGIERMIHYWNPNTQQFDIDR